MWELHHRSEHLAANMSLKEKKRLLYLHVSLVSMSTCHDKTESVCVCVCVCGEKQKRIKVRPYQSTDCDVSKLFPPSGFRERQELAMSVMCLSV